MPAFYRQCGQFKATAVARVVGPAQNATLSDILDVQRHDETPDIK